MLNISSSLRRLRHLIRDPFYFLLRLYFGLALSYGHGYQKLMNLSSTVSYFHSLGIPFPELFSIISALVEFLGGIFFALGLFSEFSSFFISLNMLFAIILGHKTVWMNVFNNPHELVSLNAFRYLLSSLMIFVNGPGIFSLDRICRRTQYEKFKTH